MAAADQYPRLGDPLLSIPRVIEMVFGADAFSQPPVVGNFYASQSGLTAMSVSKVRKVLGDRTGPRFRLIGIRVRLCDMPPGATLLPWPKRIKLPSRAAVFGPPPPPPKRMTAAVKRTEERRRAVALLRDDRDSNRVVHKVRIDNKSALTGDWRDPDDSNPNRRVARLIHGYRARDSVQTLVDNNTISRGHAYAARRFRKEYELGKIGLRPSRNLAEAPSGFASGDGPSEARMRAMQTYEATSGALLPHLLEAVIAIVIFDHTIQSYAESRRMNNRQSASGYVLASFDLLKDYYKKLDDARRKEDEPAAATAS